MYVITNSPDVPTSDSFVEIYFDLTRAQQEAVEWAKGNLNQDTFYVHEVTTRPVFRAGVKKTLNTEVIA